MLLWNGGHAVALYPNVTITVNFHSVESSVSCKQPHAACRHQNFAMHCRTIRKLISAVEFVCNECIRKWKIALLSAHFESFEKASACKLVNLIYITGHDVLNNNSCNAFMSAWRVIDILSLSDYLIYIQNVLQLDGNLWQRMMQLLTCIFFENAPT